MFADFTALKLTDFLLGSFGAAVIVSWGIWKNSKQHDREKGNSILHIFYLIMFILGSGALAATQGASPHYSALYAGFTSPAFFSVILKNNVEAERENRFFEEKYESLTRDYQERINENKIFDTKAQTSDSQNFNINPLKTLLFQEATKKSTSNYRQQSDTEKAFIFNQKDLLVSIKNILNFSLLLLSEQDSSHEDLERSINSIDKVVERISKTYPRRSLIKRLNPFSSRSVEKKKKSDSKPSMADILLKYELMDDLGQKDYRQNARRSLIKRLNPFSSRSVEKKRKSDSKPSMADILLKYELMDDLGQKDYRQDINEKNMFSPYLIFLDQLNLFTVLLVQTFLLILRINYPPESLVSLWGLLSFSPLILIIFLITFRTLQIIRDLALNSDSFQLFLKGVF